LRRFVKAFSAILFTLGSISAQTAPSTGAVTPTPGSVRILVPKNGEKITQNFVDFRYELAAPAGATSSPTFQLRLDSTDPVRTTDNTYTFTGLQAGRHTISVEVVDANNTPVQGSRAEVHFTVAAPANRQPTAPPTRRPSTAQLISASANDYAPPELMLASFQQPPATHAESPSNLPQSSSSLPLLGIIGFGVLAGGLVSALRTRPPTRRR
jgi:hypothetical protein